jgi:DNA-binding CsgD family transcriptional regulator
LLTELVPSLLERVKLERRIGEETLTLSALAAALEAIPAPALMVRQGVSVVQANQAGRMMLEQNQGKLPAELKGTHPQTAEFDITQLESPGLGPHYLAIHKGSPDRSSRLRGFAKNWDLTRRQLQVLDLIVQGESNKRIASELGCSLRTVELHVSNVLKKARAESRGGLTAKFWGQVS